jgi:hypothetical protein
VAVPRLSRRNVFRMLVCDSLGGAMLGISLLRVLWGLDLPSGASNCIGGG